MWFLLPARCRTTGLSPGMRHVLKLHMNLHILAITKWAPAWALLGIPDQRGVGNAHLPRLARHAEHAPRSTHGMQQQLKHKSANSAEA
jgi:hypothetical protein